MRGLRAAEEPPAAVPAEPEARLPLGTVIAYSSPVFGAGFMSFLVVLYLFKFATDVLLVAPAAIGAILAAARIWDAIADPAAGYWSDRSTARIGRRRAWVLASAIPLLVFFPMTWAPPAGLEGAALVAWLAVAVFGFFTAETVLLIPHAAWGAELSSSYHDRTRIFGVRSLVSLAGSLAALAGLYLLTTSANPRAAALGVALAIALATAASIGWAVARAGERPDLQGRGPQSPLAAYRDVARNPHARLLLAVFAIENLGAATLGVLVPYVMHYIIGRPELTAPILLVYFLTAIALTPTWIPLARRFGKKRLWVFSMALTAIGFTGLFFVREGDLWVLAICGLLAGTGASCGQVVGPSIQADIIDWDEHQTGERKEGVYFAAWNFVRKVGMGVIAALTGATLTLVGFVPNQAQSEQTLLAIRVLFALFPGATYVVGALLFLRFRFNEREHAEVRSDLERRRAQALEAR
jgi:GPH family glycoside/pentoside/hexuronide:cation symporter